MKFKPFITISKRIETRLVNGVPTQFEILGEPQVDLVGMARKNTIENTKKIHAKKDEDSYKLFSIDEGGW